MAYFRWVHGGAVHRFWLPARRWAFDAVVALAFVGWALIPFNSATSSDVFSSTLQLISTVCSGVLVLLRRQIPFIAVAGTFIATILVPPDHEAFMAAAIALSLYAAMVYRSTRLSWVIFAGVEVGFAAQFAFNAIILNDHFAGGSASRVTIVLIGGLVGAVFGSRRRYVRSLLERATQLVREQGQQQELAAATERSRIAREMHDIVSHSLTVMVTLADGSAAQLRTDPQRAGAALNHIGETGRHALADMRRMLGVLQADGSEATLGPMPGMNDLLSLVQHMRTAGLPITFTLPDRAVNDSAFQLTVYRIVQECLTNVMRHAPNTAEVTVKITHKPDLLTITVHNLPGGYPCVPIDSGGSGLLGMKQRVDLYAGTLKAAPTRNGGWKTVATLRVNADAEAPR